MNVRVVAMVVSLLANVALIFGIVQRTSREPEVLRSGRPALAPRSDSTSPTTRPPAAIDNITPEVWRSLSSGSLVEVAARLRAEGYPPRMQRVIIRALVEQQFAERHREIAGMIRAQPWWTPEYGSESGTKILVARQRLNREEKDAVDAVLGPDTSASEYTQAGRLYRYGNLPFAKLNELDRINTDYNELEAQARGISQFVMLPEDREELLYLEQQRQADVAQVLTPEELFEYNLRSSPTGWWLRQQLATFNPSPEEFRAIFSVEHALVAPIAHGKYQLMNAEDKKAWSNLEPQLKEQIKAVLSPERFADYELKSTAAYRDTDALVQRLELPANVTGEIVAVQNEIRKRADALRANLALSPAERTVQLGALAEEAAVRLTPVLGDTGFNAYKQNVGRWVGALRPAGAPSAQKR